MQIGAKLLFFASESAGIACCQTADLQLWSLNLWLLLGMSTVSAFVYQVWSTWWRVTWTANRAISWWTWKASWSLGKPVWAAKSSQCWRKTATGRWTNAAPEEGVPWQKRPFLILKSPATFFLFVYSSSWLNKDLNKSQFWRTELRGLNPPSLSRGRTAAQSTSWSMHARLCFIKTDVLHLIKRFFQCGIPERKSSTVSVADIQPQWLNKDWILHVLFLLCSTLAYKMDWENTDTQRKKDLTPTQITL